MNRIIRCERHKDRKVRNWPATLVRESVDRKSMAGGEAKGMTYLKTRWACTTWLEEQ